MAIKENKQLAWLLASSIYPWVPGCSSIDAIIAYVTFGHL